jgi:hypothetical protein
MSHRIIRGECAKKEKEEQNIWLKLIIKSRVYRRHSLHKHMLIGLSRDLRLVIWRRSVRNKTFHRWSIYRKREFTFNLFGTSRSGSFLFTNLMFISKPNSRENFPDILRIVWTF